MEAVRYVVQDRHNASSYFRRLEDAQAHADWLVQGWRDGTLSASNPDPEIFRTVTTKIPYTPPTGD